MHKKITEQALFSSDAYFNVLEKLIKASRPEIKEEFIKAIEGEYANTSNDK